MAVERSRSTLLHLSGFVLLLAGSAHAGSLSVTSSASSTVSEAAEDLDIAGLTVQPTHDLQRGAELFGVRCARCHGPEGRGDGPLARFVEPWPSDLTRGVFKLRSTPTGHPPTESDLFRTISKGIPGTSMPSWSGLSLEDRWQLVWFVQSLFARDDLLPAEPVALPEAPVELSSLVGRGAGIYQLMQCARCHGTSGRGDGPDAFQIQDDAGRKVRPFDFSRSWKLKAGSRPEDLYRTLWTGLDGTGMPSYGDALSANDTWALVAYVQSLFVDVRGAN